MKNRQVSIGKYYIKGLLLCMLTACMFACDKVEGPEPNPGEVPQSTAKLLTDSFPDAKNVVFKTILANALWEAHFEEGQVKYYMGLQPGKIVALHKLLGDVVPDSMQQIIREKFPIAKNAKLSDYRAEVRLDPDKEGVWYRAKITADGQDFSIKWIYSKVYNSDLKHITFGFGEHNIFTFDTDPRYEPIPTTLVDLQNRTDYFVTSLTTKVIGENKVNYYFNGKDDGSPRVITNDGVFIGSYNFVKPFKAFDEIPDPIRKQLAKFGIDERYQMSVFSGECFEDNYQSYSIFVYGYLAGYRLFFDKDGKLLAFVSSYLYEYR
ncbi:MAG: hypothetical protein J7619_11485 [Dyadobacter sp.]|uniref:hypothetical protein n=1 Tax=Dyadobacter sp. TaxID=1914288 RepID=UPI001B0A0096|nr:hypothetical protein [Dyadobacter sp.]MBO9613313.1 hypothetical protein [Dyadobacter sp.]